MSIPEGQWVSPDGSLIDRRIFSGEDIYRQEQNKVFRHCWLFLGHTSQVPNAGDFFTTYMGEEPMIVSRHKDGEVYAHINSCRHRGLRVCRGDHGNSNSFTCPYHGWTFSTNGSLVGMPRSKEYYPDFENKESR